MFGLFYYQCHKILENGTVPFLHITDLAKQLQLCYNVSCVTVCLPFSNSHISLTISHIAIKFSTNFNNAIQMSKWPKHMQDVETVFYY